LQQLIATTMMKTLLFKNAKIVDCTHNCQGEGIIVDLIIENGYIQWIGHHNKLPKTYSFDHDINLEQRLVTPGLIDCHTHLVYGGDRAAEYAQRLLGVSYEEISRQGGGILSTVKKTRSQSKEELVNSASKRLKNWMKQGFTTVEIKSGYGLDFDSEVKMLEVINALKQTFNLSIHSTLLAAHTVPPEFKNRENDYIDWIIENLLPYVSKHQLADAVDVFCESIGFSLEQSQRLLLAAKNSGFNLKIHAEQLSDLGGSKMAADLGALSCDHLEYLSPADIQQLQKTQITPVLLPAAYYFLRETKLPPIQALRNSGIGIALGSDSNPGSAPLLSPLLTLNFATTLFKMTAIEALKGMTIYGAKALGISQQVGSIEVGKIADLAIWDLDKAEELSYWIGSNPLYARVKQGVIQEK